MLGACGGDTVTTGDNTVSAYDTDGNLIDTVVTAALDESVVVTIDGIEVSAPAFNYYVEYTSLYYTYFASMYGITYDTDEVTLGANIEALAQVTEIAKIKSIMTANGYSLDEDEVDASIASEKEGFGDDDSYQTFLEQYELTEDDFRVLVEDILWVMAYSDYVTEQIVYDDAEMEAVYDANPDYYDQYTVSHILISFPEVADDETLTAEQEAETIATAQALIDRLDAGEDFATLAAEYSDDTASAESGGSLGESFALDNNYYVTEFVDGVRLLENIGDYSSEPVVSAYGAHIIILDDKTTGYENAQTTIYNEVGETAFYEIYDEEIVYGEFDVIYNSTLLSEEILVGFIEYMDTYGY